MDLAHSHLFAGTDARLDSMLSGLRIAQRALESVTERDKAWRALQEIVSYRDRVLSEVAAIKRGLGITDGPSAFEAYLRICRAPNPLNPVAEALDAYRHAVVDREALRRLLDEHYSGPVCFKATNRSAFVAWLMARTVWRRLLACIAVRLPIRGSRGFFGASKVDGRNTP